MIIEKMIGFEYFEEVNAVTIHKHIITLDEEEQEVSRTLQSKGFSCDMIEDMKLYLGSDVHPLIVFCASTWTPEVIAAYQDLLNQGV